MRPASETCPPASASSSTLPHSRIRHLVALACGGLQLALGQPSAGVFGTPAPSLHRQFANFALAGLQPQDTAVPHEQAPVTGVHKAWPTRCTAFQNPPCDHVPGCGAEACCVCSSVAVAIWLQIPGSVRAGDEARRRRRRENSICTGCFSSLQLHPAASSTTCRNKVQRTGKTVYATVLRIRSSVRSGFFCSPPFLIAVRGLSRSAQLRLARFAAEKLGTDSRVKQNQITIENEQTELPAQGREQSRPLA